MRSVTFSKNEFQGREREREGALYALILQGLLVALWYPGGFLRCIERPSSTYHPIDVRVCVWCMKRETLIGPVVL